VSLHRLPRGKGLIAAIERLGRVLGYHVELEHPLPTEGDGEPPAVDVAWFGAHGDPFPLMLFEVESSASNAMANNALKIFSQDTALFEKPLFFFHVIASGGLLSTRPQTLERFFGTYNYRIYRFDDGAGTQFVCDVLSQHRRTRGGVRFAELFTASSHNDWNGAVDPLAVIRAARDMNFSCENYLPELVRLARTNHSLIDEIETTMETPALARWFEEGYFTSYIGSRFGDAILYAMMLGRARSVEKVTDWNERLEAWQRGVDGMEMVGPFLGLSHDYDQFLRNGAGGFVCLIISLARARGTACATLCRSLGRIGKQFGPNLTGANIHAWTCHAAAALSLSEVFVAARGRIERLGGLPEGFLMCPYPLEEDSMDDWDQLSSIVPSDMTVFRRQAVEMHCLEKSDSEMVGLHALDENDFVLQWSQPILHALWSRGPDQTGAD
jgi:hypothetical protein